MLKKAQRLRTKILKFSSQTVAVTFLTRLLADVGDKESDNSSGMRWSVAARNGKRMPEVETSNADTLFQRLPIGSEGDENASVIRRLLGGYGIVLDHHSSQKGNRQLLDGAVTDRERKLVQVSREAESSFLSTIERSIHRASAAQHLLIDELFFETKFNAVKLSNSDIVARMKSLQGELERIGFSVTNLDMEKLQSIDKDREDFVNRWSVT